MRHAAVRLPLAGVLVVGTIGAIGLASGEQIVPQPAARVTTRRLPQNPLITTRTSASLGDNINGPAVIRVPPWVKQPLGRYYMYFAHHMGAFIRLAYADSIAGPWKIHEPGVVPVGETAFFRPQPDPRENLENFYTHVASPEIHVDSERERLILWFHGWYTEGQRWPAADAAARKWAGERGYGQFTQAAESTDGLHFNVRPSISKTSYLRVFSYGAHLYGMARLGLLLRSADPLAAFEAGPHPFRDGPYAGRVRHVAVSRRGGHLYVFFTAIGDAPERVMLSTIATAGEWASWRASDPVDVLQPDAPYECTHLPIAPSQAGDIKRPARQLRDPALLEEGGRTYLFYSFCGEQGIAAAELTFHDSP
jgi:hypothetical protein